MSLFFPDAAQALGWRFEKKKKGTILAWKMVAKWSFYILNFFKKNAQCLVMGAIFNSVLMTFDSML